MTRRNVPGHYADRVSSWRRLAAASWRPADDPTIYGTLSIDATKVLEYLGRPRLRAHHVTVTHLVTKAVADTLARHPECNAFVRNGRIYVRDDVEVFVLVAVPPIGEAGRHDLEADLTGVKICRANEKTVIEIADEVAAAATGMRRGRDPALASVKRMLSVVPPVLLKPALRLISRVQYDINLDLSRFGIPRDPFGGAFVTSVGMLGIERAFAPIVPMTRLSVNVAVGRIADAPVAENGSVVVRPMLPLTATFDHRTIDGYHAGRLADTFTAFLRDPETHFACD
jgi:pyruvate dehydrogenase E2 component (dihydrolipoamide acetyltransferase)